MAEITYQTAIQRCRECYIFSSAYSPSQKDEQNKKQFRTIAVLEVLTNEKNYAAMEMLKGECVNCDRQRPTIVNFLTGPIGAGALALLEKTDPGKN